MRLVFDVDDGLLQPRVNLRIGHRHLKMKRAAVKQPA
jgi:hypothetical protein